MTTDPPFKNLLLSVITPAYNQAEFLRDTIESVLAQDYPHIEYRVIDDGSTDQTTEVLRNTMGESCGRSKRTGARRPQLTKGAL